MMAPCEDHSHSLERWAETQTLTAGTTEWTTIQPMTGGIYGKFFDELKLPSNMLKKYSATLVGFSAEQVAVRGYLELRTTFGEKEDAKTVVLLYMVVQAQSSNNLIMGRPTLNPLLVVVSYPHLCVKYPLPGDNVGTVKGDQEMARKCYVESVKVKLVQRGKKSDRLGKTTTTKKGDKKKKKPAAEHESSKKPG